MIGSFDNVTLMKNANLPNVKIQHIFCGYVPNGRWKSSLSVNRLIYVFECGKAPGGIGTDDDFCPLLPNTWLFIPAYHEVLHEENEGLKLISIHFNAGIYANLELFSECKKIVHGIAPEYLPHFQRLLTPENDFSTGFLLKYLLYLFMEEKILPELPSIDHFREKYHRFSALLDVFQNDPCRNLTVPQMARIMNMGKESFIKHFQTETGSSPKFFFNRIRAAAAAEALNHLDTRIRDIAFQFGFANEFYFSRFFKRHFGLSPKDYRERFC